MLAMDIYSDIFHFLYAEIRIFLQLKNASLITFTCIYVVYSQPFRIDERYDVLELNTKKQVFQRKPAFLRLYIYSFILRCLYT